MTTDTEATSPDQNTAFALEPFLFTPEEAAVLLRIDVGWLRRKAASRLVPCTVLGRTVRFSRSDLDELIITHAEPVHSAHPDNGA